MADQSGTIESLSMDSVINKINEFVPQKSVDSILSTGSPLRLTIKLLLVLYGGLVAPKLGEFAKPIFDNVIFKIAFFFLMAYVANNDPTMAILMATAFVLSITYLKKNEQKKEGFDGSCSLRL